VWHRGETFTARDIFDLALVVEKEPGSLDEIAPVLRDRRAAILDRMTRNEAALRENFARLIVLDYRPSFDDCVRLISRALAEVA
jgi:hypothetical protein